MKKILSGVFSLLLLAGVVSGTAYAAWVSNTAAVEGISFTAGDANLAVSLTGLEGSFLATVSSLGSFSGLFPGSEPEPKSIWFKNTSTVNINLVLSGKLRPGVDGDWDLWKNKVQVAIAKVGFVGDLEWHDLETWHLTGASVQGTPLEQNAVAEYKYYVRVTNPADGIQNQTLSSVEFDFVGTQTP